MNFAGRGWIRWSIGILALLFAFKVALKGIGAGGFGIVGVLLIAVAMLILAAVCFSPEVVGFVTRPLTRWIDGIYLPGGRPDPAPLNYRLTSYYEMTRQFGLAAAEYRRILDDYPAEGEAYRGLVDVLVSHLDDRRAARRWLKRGLRKVADREQRETLLVGFGYLLGPEERSISA